MAKLAPAPTGFTEEVTPQELALQAQANAGRAPGEALRVEVRGDQLPPPPAGFTEMVPLGQGGDIASQDLPGSPADAVTQDTPTLPQTSVGGAGFRGLGDMALLGGRDELAAAAGAVGNKIGNALGMNQSTASFGDIYRQLWEEEQQKVAADQAQHGGARVVGQGLGLLASAALPVGKIAQGANWLNRIGRGAAIGAGYGGVSGTLDSTPDDRTAGTLGGAGLGAAFGGALPPVAAFAGRVAAPIIERLGLGAVGERAMSGMNALSRRARQNPGDMAAQGQRYRDAGFEPTLVDVMDESGRGVVRAAASRNTPGRDTAQAFADARRVDLQDDVSRVAERISPESRATNEVVTEAQTARNTLADEQFRRVAPAPVPITPELVSVLSTGEGRTAMRMAERLLEPEERAALRQVQAAVAQVGRLDPRLPEAARAQIQEQLLNGAELTVDLADKISRSLLGRAQTGANPGLSRVLTSLGQTVRDAARTAAPEYGQALDNYAAQSALTDAAETGARFMSGNADEFGTAARGLSDEAAVLPLESGEVTLPTERAVARTAARRAVELKAGESPRAAMETAERLAVGNNGRNRAEALIGPEDAARLQEGMGIATQRVRNAQFVAPRTGSQTQGRDQDAEALSGALNFIGNAMTGKLGMVRAVGQFVAKAGLRDVDAQRLVDVATDPARFDEAINYLIQRGATPIRARQIADGIRRGGAELIGSESGPEYRRK